MAATTISTHANGSATARIIGVARFMLKAPSQKIRKIAHHISVPTMSAFRAVTHHRHHERQIPEHLRGIDPDEIGRNIGTKTCLCIAQSSAQSLVIWSPFAR
jgi:hypothetical protein